MDFSRKPELPACNEVFLFGEFELNPGRGLLLQNGIEIPLRHQCFDVLMYLIQHRGILVTKQELIAAVWPTVVVTESSVSQCICTIRRALDDASKTLIRLVPRSGYIFDTPVMCKTIPVIAEAGSNWSLRFFSHPQASHAIVIGIALVLIVLLGGSIDYISEGNLAIASKDPVASRDALALKDLAASKDLATSKNLVASKEEGSAAMEQYRLGTFFYGRRAPGDIVRAIDQFRSAVALDPHFANAWVGLAGTYRLKSLSGGPLSLSDQEEYLYFLKKALGADPDNPEANMRIALYYGCVGNKELARQYLDRALELGGNDALVLSLAAGIALDEFRYTDAVAFQQRAVLLEPLSFTNQRNLGHFLEFAGRFDEAIAVYQTSQGLNYGHEQDSIAGLFRCYFLQGRFNQAAAFASQLADGPARYQSLALLDIALNKPGKSSEMIAKLSEQSGIESVLSLVEFYAYTGDTSSVFQWLEIAKNQYFAADQNGTARDQVLQIRHSVLLRPITNDARWITWQKQFEIQNYVQGPMRELANNQTHQAPAFTL